MVTVLFQGIHKSSYQTSQLVYSILFESASVLCFGTAVGCGTMRQVIPHLLCSRCFRSLVQGSSGGRLRLGALPEFLPVQGHYMLSSRLTTYLLIAGADCFFSCTGF